MPEFWRVERVAGEGEAWIEDFDEPPAWSGYFLGEPIPRARKPARYVHAECGARRPDILAGVIVTPVVSERFADLLRDAEPEHVELHPVEVACGGKAKGGYFFLNVLHNVAAVDRDASDVDISESYGDIEGVRRLVLRDDAVGKRSIFRLAELPSELWVRDSLKARIEEAGITGLRFTPLEEFRSG